MRYLVLLTGICTAVACEEGGDMVAVAHDPLVPPRETPRVVGFIPDLVVEVDETVVIEDPQRVFSDGSALTLSVTSSDGDYGES